MLRSSCDKLCFGSGYCPALEIRGIFCQFCVGVCIVQMINVVHLQSISSAEGSQSSSQNCSHVGLLKFS